MSSKKDNRVNNSRRVSNKKSNRKLSPREELEIKKKLRRKAKKIYSYKKSHYGCIFNISNIN